MRILTISLNAWNDTLATGNSFSNFFSNRDEGDAFANIYCRSERINNSICSRYFRVTEKDILKSFARFSSAGSSFDASAIDNGVVSSQESLLSTNNPQGNLLRRLRPASLLFLRELIWYIPTWKGKKIKQFLADFKPDIIYMHVHSNWYMHKLLWFCQKLTGAKVVVFSGDDVWSYKQKGILHLLYHWRLRHYLRKTFTSADVVLGGSPQLCKEFGEVFKINIKPLYKTCNNISVPNKKEYRFPLKAVYCGNLLYGRDDVLVLLAKQLPLLNKDGIKLQLFIYSNTLLSNDKMSVLDDGINCFYKGAKPFSEIIRILNESDFSIFAESYNPRCVKETRLSFSTKIIDYMQASSAIIAVGPSEIASIDYLKRSGLAIVVDKPDDFLNVMEHIISTPDDIFVSTQHKYEYALKNHSKPSLLQKMRGLL